MKSTKKMILGQMAAISCMERGKLCPMRDGRYYNLQSWEDGRNVVRYVPKAEERSVREAVRGYRKFRLLAEKYADMVIRDTRKAEKKASLVPKNRKRKKN